MVRYGVGLQHTMVESFTVGEPQAAMYTEMIASTSVPAGVEFVLTQTLNTVLVMKQCHKECMDSHLIF